MTTLRTIVSDGLRESGILQIGTDPEADEFLEGFRRLTNIISSLFGKELGENFSTVTLGLNNLSASRQNENLLPEFRNKWLSSNTRYVCNLTSAEILYLDPNPQDGARLSVVDAGGNFATRNLTLVGNGRLIENSSSVLLNTNGTNSEWFYRDDLANWQKISVLTENDQSPFPAEFDDLLTTLLALRLNPRYGVETRQETASILNEIKQKFKARYKQTESQLPEQGLVRLSGNRRYSLTWN